MMFRGIIHQLGLNVYANFLNSIHRVQLIGRKGTRPYYQAGTKGIFHTSIRKELSVQSGRDVYSRFDTKRKDAQEFRKKVNTGEYDFNIDQHMDYLKRCYARFESYIQLPVKASKRDIVKSVAAYYYQSIKIYLWGNLGKNNSIFMNIVNALLELRGISGISHGHLDSFTVDGPKRFLEEFWKSVKSVNPGIDIGEAPTSFDGAMAAADTGGIDLTPANMHLQTQNSNGESSSTWIPPCSNNCKTPPVLCR